jgi:hypothetical protein
MVPLTLWLSLTGNRFYGLLFALECVGLLLTSLPRFMPAIWLPRFLLLGAYIVEGYAASCVGATRYLLGQQKRPWVRAKSAG